MRFICIVSILLSVKVADVTICISEERRLWFLLVVLLFILFVLYILVPAGPRFVVIRVLRRLLVTSLSSSESTLTRIVLSRLTLISLTATTWELMQAYHSLCCKRIRTSYRAIICHINLILGTNNRELWWWMLPDSMILSKICLIHYAMNPTWTCTSLFSTHHYHWI